MRQSVQTLWFDYSVKHEGFTPFPYADRLNLVTTGIGNLVDLGPADGHVVNAQVMAPALLLPWKLRAPGWSSKNPVAGALLSPSEVADAWQKVKLQNLVVPGFEQRGGFAYAGLTNITLDMDGIKQLFAAKTASVNKDLVKTYPGFETWPADAQLATMSMAWAMGAAFYPIKGFAKFKQAVDRLDFTTAIKEGQFGGGGNVTDAGDPKTGRPASRNHDNAIMFSNAAIVQKAGADPDRLWFPDAANPASSALVASIAGKGVGGTGIALGAAAVGAAGWFGWKWYKGRK